MEMDEIKARLSELETHCALLQDQLDSHLQVHVKLLRLLHEKELLALPDVIAALQSGSAFAQAAFDKRPPHTLPVVIGMLQAIADALAERGRPR
jgi:hypothetical protein